MLQIFSIDSFEAVGGGAQYGKSDNLILQINHQLLSVTLGQTTDATPEQNLSSSNQVVLSVETKALKKTEYTKR